MNQNRRVLQIFVSSPDDMELERQRLGEIVQSINQTWGHVFKIQYDLISWETHGLPGFAADAQDVLNEQLPDNYDVFIGLMWCRFGTPTGRAGSGTEEEFNRAYARFKEDPASVRIMFYFKDTPISPSDIDPDQYGRVLRFRESLGDKGGLYGTFESEEKFAEIVRTHLSFVLQKAKDQYGPSSKSPPEPVENEEKPDEDLGLLEYVDIWDESATQLAEIIYKLNDETEDYGNQIREITAECEAVVEKSKGQQIGKKKARDLFGKGARTIEHFVDKINSHIPEFDDCLLETAGAGAHIVRIITSYKHKNIEEMERLLEDFSNLHDGLGGAISEIEGLQQSMVDFPPMSKELVKAKRKANNIVQQLLDSMSAGKLIFGEAINTLKSAIENGEEPKDE